MNYLDFAKSGTTGHGVALADGFPMKAGCRAKALFTENLADTIFTSSPEPRLDAWLF